ncbi:MAG: glycosyltransferase [Bdellovibrionales bacterium]
MPDLPKISVIMAAFNGRNLLPAAVRSLQKQTLTEWELILIDDASTDGGCALVSQLGDSRIRVIQNEKNRGLAASLNRGIDLAQAPYIARMDCDDICFPDRLQRQLEFLESHPAVDLVGSNALEFSKSGAALAVTSLPLDHEGIVRKMALGGTPLYHPAWCGKSVWFKRHRYDESFAKAQDFELLIRAAEGSSFANLPDVLLGYRREGLGLLKRLRTRIYVLRACQKNFFCAGRYGRFMMLSSATMGRMAVDLARAVFGVCTRGYHTPYQSRGDDSLRSSCSAQWKRLWNDLFLS